MKAGIDYPGVSVVFYCHDGDGNVLMSKRSNQCRDEIGCWDVGAGGVDLHHTVEDTLRKEIKEEYCTDVLDFEFLGSRDVHREHNGQKTHWITLDYKVLIDKSKVSNGEPHKLEEVAWFPKGKLPEPLHSQFPYFLEKYKRKL